MAERLKATVLKTVKGSTPFQGSNPCLSAICSEILRVIRLILIDDHDLVRFGLKTFLTQESDIEVIADYCTIEDAKPFLAELQPHVILLDFQHPTSAIQSIIETFKQLAPQAKLVVLSCCDEEFLASRLLSMGVCAYLDRQSNTEDLLTAIRKAGQGLRYVPSSIAKQLMLSSMTQPKKSLMDTPFALLSGREMDCLLLLVQGKSTNEIAETLGVHAKTVNTYRYRIFQKLQVSGDVELVKLAMRYGLLNSANP
jgi:two-component system, NarL family, invasion response regulator UvrY